jgi:hypothetical protein
MTYFHSEAPADQRKLQQAQRAQEAAEAEIIEVDESIVIVDRLLSEILAEEAERARAALEAKFGELRTDQAEAFTACAGKFAELFDLWKAFAATEETLQSGAALRRDDVGYQTVERVLHLVPDLGRDVGVELSGQGTQPLRGF